jgi:hypothetical protein
MQLNDATIKMLENYLNDNMSAEERALFEQEISTNKELKEFLNLNAAIDAFEDKNAWIDMNMNAKEIKSIAQKFRNADTIAFTNKVNSFHKSYSQKPKNRRNIMIAFALVAACSILILLWPSSTNLNTVYANYSSWAELPSFMVKGDDLETQKIAMESAFKSKQYTDAIALCNTIINNSKTIEPSILIYKGIAQLELDKYEESIKTFTQLYTSNTIDAHKGYWYISLVYAKQGNKELFIKALKKVSSNPTNYKYEEALKILQEIE